MPTLQEWLNKQNDENLSGKLLSVSDANPELAAQSVKQARANNIPPSLTPFEPDPALDQQARLNRVSSTVQSTKTLKQWLSQQPDVVAASVQDDVENMSLIESVLSVPRAILSGAPSLTGGVLGVGAMAAGALRTAGDYVSKAGMVPLSPASTLLATSGAAEQFFTEQARAQEGLAEFVAGKQAIEGPISGGIYGGLKSIGQQLPALAAGLATRNPQYAVSLMSASVTGAEYLKAREQLDFVQAAPYATLQGLFEYATEVAPVFQLFKDLKVDESFLKILGKQLLLEVPGEQAATVLQDLNEWANLNPEKPFKEYLAERPAAALETLVATIVGVGGNVSITKAVNYLLERDTYSQQANETAALLGELDTLAKASVVRQRDVETFEGFLQTATQDSPVESLYIDSQALMQSGLADVLAAQSPTVAAQLEQASAGTMIRIPTSEVMGRFNQELTPLLPEMRVDPNGMSQKEAEEYVSTRGEQLRAEVESVLSQNETESAAQEARAAVRDTVAQELMATGRVTQDVADNYALLTSTFYHVMAQRMGTTADKLFGEQRLRVMGAGRGAFEQADIAMPEGTAPGAPVDVQSAGRFPFLQNEDGAIVVQGDVDQIRASLPQGVLGRKVQGGLSFGVIDAPRVLSALRGEKLTYGRAGQVLEKLPMKNGKYIGAPEKYNTPETIEDLRKSLLDLALEGEYGRFWYEDSGRAIIEYVGGDLKEARKLLALMSIYSPQAKVDANSTFAIRAWAQYKAGQPISVKTGHQDAKANAAMADIDAFWSGEKTGNFINNLLRVVDPSLPQGATIDMWMMRAGEYDTDAPTKTQYAFMENETNRIARELGWEPQQVQAAIWVAMKARMENADVKKKTEESSEKNGWIRFERDEKGVKRRIIIDEKQHRDNWLKFAREHVPNADDKFSAGFHFGDGLARHIGQVSFEARPGKSTGVLPGIHTAPYEQQLEFQQAIDRVFYDPISGADLIASYLGLLTDSDIIAPGVWEGEVSPSSQRNVVMAPAKGTAGRVDPAQAKLLNIYASLKGLLTRQEGVGWHKPYYATTRRDANGLDINVGRPLTPQETVDLSNAIGAWMLENNKGERWNDSFALISSPNGIRLVNFGVIENSQLQSDIIQVAEKVLPDAKAKMFSSDGDMPSNNWRENSDGQDYVGRIRAEGRSDVLDWAANVLAPRIQQVFEDFSQRYGWGDPGSIAIAPKAKREEFLQGEGQEVRGSFSPEELTIRLTKAQDLSTFLHESGHFYLHMLVNLASRPDAPADVRKDAETILNWFGVKGTPEMNQFDAWLNMSVDEQRPSHERFARSFEVYLAEGKAPSTELQPMFDRFRSWLMSVYRSLMERAKATFGREVSFGKAMQAELNDEVRAVFDRLLATQEEIEAKEAAQSMGMLFKTEAEAKKFGVDWNAYQAQGEAATQQAISDLAAKSIQDMKWLENARSRLLTKLQREEKEARRNVRSMVRPEIMSQPLYRAWSYLTGPLTDDPNAEPTSRFSPEYLEQVTASKEVVAELRKLRMVAGPSDIKKGVSGEHPDTVAETFGFSSGSELIRAILASPTPDEAINAETDARMLRDFSDLSTAEGRNNAVNAALANDARTRMVETELSALEQAMAPTVTIGGRKQRTLPGAAKAFARSVINRLKIRDVRVSQYSGSAARAARNADRAVKRGKLAEAALEKRNQLVNNYAARFAGEALDDVKKGLAYLKKFTKEGTRKNIDPEYLDQIDRILERFDLRQKTLRELDRRSALAQFIENQKELGIEPDLPAHIVNEAQAVNYKNLTVEEFAGLVDSIRQIEHFGRLKRKLLLAKDKREFDALMAEIRASVIANDQGRVADNRTRTDLGNILSRAFKSFTAAHRKMSSIVYEIDGFKDGGPLWDALVRTANERGNWEADKQAELTTRLAQLLKALPKERAFGKGRYFPMINDSLKQEERLAVALNWGNEGNRQRLLDGRNWTTDGVQQVLDSLSQEEWDFVQGVWDTFESLRPEIARVERNLMGKEPEWIEAVPIQTKFGTYRGGYYPAVYDPGESLRTEQLNAEEEAKRQLRGARTAATVRSNFVKGRAEQVKGRPILLTMDATFNGLTDVVHYLAYKEWLVDANRILRAVDGTIRERYGAEMTRQLRTAVEAIAAGEQNNPHALDKPLRHIRIGSMVAGLGFNIVNAVMQPLGLTQSMVRIGPKYIAQGVAAFAKNPVKLATSVLEKSSFMRNRKRTQNRELNELRNSLRGKTESRQFIDGAMFLPMTAIQMTVDIPTWWGAYQKAQTEGFDEDTSVQIADQAVIASQGGGQTKDLAAIQRGSEFVKIFTVFYGYFNTAYNLGVERIRATNPRSPSQVARLATDLLLIYSVPAVLGALIKEAFKIGDDDDDEEIANKLAAEQVSFLFGTMVGVREAAGAAQIMLGLSTSGGLGYNGPAGLRFFNELNKFAQQANQDELDRAFVRAGVNVAGIALHLPSAQINRTVDGVIAMSEGRTENPVALIGGAPPQ